MPCDATIITRNPSPSITQPSAIFVTLLGSCRRPACQPQNEIRSGVNAKIMNGLNAWYHVDGSVKPKIEGQCVLSSAHSCSVLPCCSHTAQNAGRIRHASQ